MQGPSTEPTTEVPTVVPPSTVAESTPTATVSEVLPPAGVTDVPTTGDTFTATGDASTATGDASDLKEPLLPQAAESDANASVGGSIVNMTNNVLGSGLVALAYSVSRVHILYCLKQSVL